MAGQTGGAARLNHLDVLHHVSVVPPQHRSLSRVVVDQFGPAHPVWKRR
jgi:hypothetical protein